MKIAYILEVNPYENSGILKKVNDQINYWENAGCEVHLLCPWPTPALISQKRINGLFISSRLLNKLPDGGVKNFLNKVLCAGKLRNKLRQINPDILYIRQNTWYPGLISILKENKTVLELNTVDIIEAKYFSSLKRAIYLFGRERILNNSKGLIAVSPDILKHYKKYGELEKMVVSNGINLSRISKAKRDKENQTINLIFVGIKDTAWHGLDKVIELAKIFPQYCFNIVGPNESDFKNYPKNVRFYGWVEKNQLEKLYEENHFGIGSFANYLVGKEVDSTLKVREYLAYGLPVILGHWDVDFMDSEFVLKVTDENHEILNSELIQQYLQNYKNYVVNNGDLKIIDSKTKEQERLNFFRKISKK